MDQNLSLEVQKIFHQIRKLFAESEKNPYQFFPQFLHLDTYNEVWSTLHRFFLRISKVFSETPDVYDFFQRFFPQKTLLRTRRKVFGYGSHSVPLDTYNAVLTNLLRNFASSYNIFAEIARKSWVFQKQTLNFCCWYVERFVNQTAETLFAQNLKVFLSKSQKMWEVIFCCLNLPLDTWVAVLQNRSKRSLENRKKNRTFFAKHFCSKFFCTHGRQLDNTAKKIRVQSIGFSLKVQELGTQSPKKRRTLFFLFSFLWTCWLESG